MADTPLKRSLRLVSIMELFRQEPHRGFTTEELAQLYGVSQRAIQRDLEDLQDEPIRAAPVDDADAARVVDVATLR